MGSREAERERLGGAGRRVDEALDRLVEPLDGAASGGHERLVVVHGTGALRRAVREWLAGSPA